MDIDDDESPVVPAPASGFLSLADLGESLPAVQATPAPTSQRSQSPSLAALLQHLPRAPRHRPAVPPPTTPPSSAHTPALPLDSTAYPHLVELVAAHADLPTLLAFRRTSRSSRKQVDAMLDACINPERSTYAGRFMRAVPKLEDHSRVLLPPYTVVDRVSLHAADAAFRISPPAKTRRHVVVLECDSHNPPVPRSMSVSPEIRHFDLVRPLGSERRADGPYPPILDIVFAAGELALLGHLTKQLCTTDRVEEEDKWPEGFEMALSPFQVNAMLAHTYLDYSDPVFPGFFGHVVRWLSVAQRLLSGGEAVRIWGLKSLSPSLVKQSLGPLATDEEVAAAAVDIVRNRLLFHRAFFTPGTDVDVCLSRLEVHEGDL